MDKLLSGRRVLVVEDEMMILMMIEGMLDDLGCASVSAAATIDQAIAFIKDQSFDIAMLDLNLNGEKTYPIADALAAHNIPFLFSTGYSDHGMKDGYDHRPVLRKPFQHQDLANMLECLLSTTRPSA